MFADNGASRRRWEVASQERIVDQAKSSGGAILEAVLDAWDRSSRVLINLLQALPVGGLSTRATSGSPSVSQMLMHVHHERLVSVAEEAPEVGVAVPDEEWQAETDPRRIERLLEESADAVRSAVISRVAAGRGLDQHFGHPIQLIAFLIFHEGYHHGQIKLALKASGTPMPDHVAGPQTWDVWRRR